MHSTIKRFVFSIGLLIFWMGAADAGQQAEAATDPRVVLPSQQHIFEPVVEGDQTKHAFTLGNSGAADLLLLDVKAD